MRYRSKLGHPCVLRKRLKNTICPKVSILYYIGGLRPARVFSFTEGCYPLHGILGLALSTSTRHFLTLVRLQY